MFKGVVFDLDGTLIDSPLCFKSIRKELDIPEGEYILEYLANLPQAIQLLKMKALEKIEFAAATQATPYPGVLSLLRSLEDLGINIGIFTRNCRSATEYVVGSLGFPIDKIVTREDAPPKPDPTGLRSFLEHWKLEESELLYVGDFRFDIECGKKAGVKTALFTQGQMLNEDWSPDYVLSDYSLFWQMVTPAKVTP